MPVQVTQLPETTFHWLGLGADEWAALGTWAAVVAALLISLGGWYRHTRSHRLQKRVWGPAAVMRSGRLLDKLVLLLHNSDRFKETDPGSERVDEFRGQIAEMLLWPTVDDVARLATVLPEAAGKLALAREHLLLAKEHMDFAKDTYGGKGDGLHRPRLVGKMRHRLDLARKRVYEAQDAADPAPLSWRVREASWRLIPKRWRHWRPE